MLSDDQITDIWEAKIAAEVRSLYFGDLASRFSAEKQWITGLSFFLASGAMATLIGKLPLWIPITFSMIVALSNAYSVAVGLDSKIRTMGKLHFSWAQIGNDYDRLWNHTYSEDAQSELDDLRRRELEISELATTDAPYDEKRLARWQDLVHRLHRLGTA